MRALDESTFVAAQIWPADVSAAAAEGVTMIVNNRPDFEEAGQPEGAEIEAAALAAGLDYRFIPVSSGISEAQIGAMAEALEAAGGKSLAFCRSGTRSTMLWALARARLGETGESLARKAAAAGYDLAPIRGILDRS
ncbi:MAG TPA: TIGR01244 family sulfur transferase [Allosphingosinicella sp.]